MTTTNNSGDMQHLKDQHTPTASKSQPAAAPSTSTDEAPKDKSAEPALEQAFFFGLTIDDAVNSTDNLMELFYNACKYNHLELVRRCVEEKHIDVNELINNDYPLCIAW